MEVYPRLTVRSLDDDPIQDEEEDSRSNEGDGRTAECLSPVGLQSIVSLGQQGSKFQNRPQTSCGVPSRPLSRVHRVSFTSTSMQSTENAGKDTGDKADTPNMISRPRAVVSSIDNDDLIALQNKRTEKKTPRVTSCYVNPPSNKKQKDENKILGSVPVSATKPKKTPGVTKCYINPPSDKIKKDEDKILASVPVSVTKPKAQVSSTAKQKAGSRTTSTRKVAVIAKAN